MWLRNLGNSALGALLLSACGGGATEASGGSGTASVSHSTASDRGRGGGDACQPLEGTQTEGGGLCAGLNEAYTARGINVGYYPYRVKRAIDQISGDYSGTDGQIFEPGGEFKGVVLQTIPAGAYVGLSSTGPNYNPPQECFEAGGECPAKDRPACTNDSPPRRPSVAGFAWGYAYGGAPHMQGWIPFDPEALEFAGFDPSHPCALGPAEDDFEVWSACGAPTSCTGANPTCGETNRCTDGEDHCGKLACGSKGGGPSTPSAPTSRKTVTRPSGAHHCTTRRPPQPDVTCLPNGPHPDFFFVYPFGAYLYWAENVTTKAWVHHGDEVLVYFHNQDADGVHWDFVEVVKSGAPLLTPPSDGAGAGGACSASHPEACVPCKNGGTCGWIQSVFLE
jgi:hypothetical protein